MLVSSTIALLLVAPSGADPERRTVIVDTAPAEDRKAQRELDDQTPGFATAIDLDKQVGARPSDALPELMTRAPGVTVRSIGGLGQFSAVSVRGSSAQQVSVFVDGVPIGDSVGGLVNVGDLPLDGLRRVEVYRGHVPVAFGGAAIGGAINLVGATHRVEPALSAAAGFGSFTSRQASASVSLPTARDIAFTGHVGYAGSTGDFPYFDDSGTPQTADDDTTTVRTNNHYDRLLGTFGVEATRRRWNVRGQQWVLWKAQGVPGTAAVQSTSTSLESWMLRTTLYAGERPRTTRSRVEWVAGIGAQRRAFVDPLDEVGNFANDELTWSVDGYLSPRLAVPLWRGATLNLVADQRSEWVRVQERSFDDAGDAQRARFAYGFGVELDQRLFRDRWQLVPVFRIDALDSRFDVGGQAAGASDEGRDVLDVGYSPRLASRLKVVRGLQLRASGGRYFRPPTLLELFGDRGYIIGNEALAAERGTSVDGGLVLDREFRFFDVYAQLAGFGVWSDDLIQWVQAGLVTRPENVAGARLRGLELSLATSAFSRTVTLEGNYTLLDSENRSPEVEQRGKPLPGRPRHELFGRLSAGYEWDARGVEIEPRVFYTVEHIAGTFLDPSGRRQVPRRTLHGLGAELHLLRRIHVAFEVRNLLDLRVTTWAPPIAGVDTLRVPVSDFIGFPLPGRSVWATLRVAFDPTQTRRRSGASKGNEP